MVFLCGCGRWLWKFPLVQRKFWQECCESKVTGMRIYWSVGQWRPWMKKQTFTSMSETPWLHIPPETTWCWGRLNAPFSSFASHQLSILSVFCFGFFLTKNLCVRTRTWLTDLPKGACALVCTSVDHNGVAVVGFRANILVSRYYIEPCGGNKSRLTHISRIDCR